MSIKYKSKNMAKQISNGANKKVVFKKRVPEPKEMGREEMKAFAVKKRGQRH